MKNNQVSTDGSLDIEDGNSDQEVKKDIVVRSTTDQSAEKTFDKKSSCNVNKSVNCRKRQWHADFYAPVNNVKRDSSSSVVRITTATSSNASNRQVASESICDSVVHNPKCPKICCIPEHFKTIRTRDTAKGKKHSDVGDISEVLNVAPVGGSTCVSPLKKKPDFIEIDDIFFSK